MKRLKCPVEYLDLSSRELELLDGFAVAFASAESRYGGVYEEALWCIADRRAIAAGEHQPARWDTDLVLNAPPAQ